MENEIPTNTAEVFEDFGPSYDLADPANHKVQSKAGFDKGKAIGYMERSCPKLVQAAQEAGQWDWICKQPLPSLYAEQFAIHLAIKDTEIPGKYSSAHHAVRDTLKRVKRHLIYRNMTVLEANENSMLGAIVEFCVKQDAVKPLKAHSTDRVFSAEDEAEVKTG